MCEEFFTPGSLMQLLGKSQAVRVELFGVVGKLCQLAASGVQVRENRIAKAIVAVGSTILSIH